MKRQEVTTRYYEFLKALKHKLNNNGAAMVMTEFTSYWKIPPAAITVMKRMGWLESTKNVQRKWVYKLNLEKVEPWHGETLRQRVKTYISNKKGVSGTNSSKTEVEPKAKGDNLKQSLDKAHNQVKFSEVKNRVKGVDNGNTLSKFSDKVLKEALEKRGYVVELWRKVEI